MEQLGRKLAKKRAAALEGAAALLFVRREHGLHPRAFLGIRVDRKFIGFPPIPQKKAEWMGHGSL
jgi:hypothetical protein